MGGLSEGPHDRSPELLHVAALPFPTHQGTQAAIDAMLRAHASSGDRARLLCYHGRAFDRVAAYAVDRLRDVPADPSLRSGPSLKKIALDLQLTARLRRLERTRRPERIYLAHHVEAALAAVLARARPSVFIAHTVLGPELPTYLPPALLGSIPLAAASARWLTPILERSGALLEQFLALSVDRVAAISPAIAESLSARSGVPVRYVPVPWPMAEIASADARTAARRELGLGPEQRVVLYAGNLDRYQGFERIVDAVGLLAAEQKTISLLLHTASDPAPFLARAAERGVTERTHVTIMQGERERAMVHAAADVAVVPREAPGGIPIKLLDALARGCPVVVERRATAGLPIENAVTVVEASTAHALARELARILDRNARGDAAERGHAYLKTHHSDAAYRTALGDVLPFVYAGHTPFRGA